MKETWNVKQIQDITFSYVFQYLDLIIMIKYIHKLVIYIINSDVSLTTGVVPTTISYCCFFFKSETLVIKFLKMCQLLNISKESLLGYAFFFIIIFAKHCRTIIQKNNSNAPIQTSQNTIGGKSFLKYIAMNRC